MSLKLIDLNVDIAEGALFDSELLKFATSANVCCGVHAGDEELTVGTIAKCRQQGVRVGAHPGYPDRASMGRASIQPGQEREYLKSIFDQVEWMATLGCDYVKPHGAFYNDTAVALPSNWEFSVRTRPLVGRYESGGLFLAQYPGVHSLIMLLRIHKLPLLGLPSTAHEVIAQRGRQGFIREGFADRAYLENGTLIPRSELGAVLTDPTEVAAQVLRLAPVVDSICLHGDSSDCLEFAETVYRTLVDGGYEVGF